ncbi:unnamed protein product, partial [Effrenium voratum]
AACRALRNLARLPRLRRPLAAAAAAAVAKLAEDAALCGSAAAALCNLGCCPEASLRTERACLGEAHQTSGKVVQEASRQADGGWLGESHPRCGRFKTLLWSAS